MCSGGGERTPENRTQENRTQGDGATCPRGHILRPLISRFTLSHLPCQSQVSGAKISPDRYIAGHHDRSAANRGGQFGLTDATGTAAARHQVETIPAPTYRDRFSPFSSQADDCSKSTQSVPASAAPSPILCQRASAIERRNLRKSIYLRRSSCFHCPGGTPVATERPSTALKLRVHFPLKGGQ